MGDGETRDRVHGGAAITLIILTGIYACHSLDRAVVSVVIEPLKRELHLTDSSVGVITGLGYGVAFALAGLPVGALADRINRVRLMAALAFAWSAMTALAGLGQSSTALLATRMAVGAAEAGGQPTALSILSDHFPEKRRATALGIFYLGASLGYCASFFGGAMVAQTYGWRAAFLLAGAPGVFLAAMLLMFGREPDRGRGTRPARSPSFRHTLGAILEQPAVRHLYFGMTLAAFTMAVVFTWMVPLMMREHGLSLPTAGLAAGVTLGVAQAIGSVLSGYVADRTARTARHRIAYVPAAALLAAVPLALGFILLGDARSAIVSLVFFGLVSTAWTTSGYTAILSLVEPL